ncbi:MAG: hypothetical protein ABWZ25_12790 [Chitinophagaceae bacterium]
MKLTAITFLLILSTAGKLYAQPLAGHWTSADGTRVYHIYSVEAEMQAVLENSVRVTDKSGSIILTAVEKKNNRRYKGFIHSVDGEMLTTVIIKFNTDDQLTLKLRRFIFPVRIKWYRVKES